MTPEERANYLLSAYTLEFSIRVSENRRMVAIADNATELAEYWRQVFIILSAK